MVVQAIRAPRGERPRVPAIIPFVYTPLSDLRCRHCPRWLTPGAYVKGSKIKL